MANAFSYKDQTYHVGDEVKLNYRIKEDDKERLQLFDGIIVKVRGDSLNTRMVTIRKISRSGIGVERIIPLSSPLINDIKLVKKSSNRRAKIYYIRNLSDQQLRTKLYKDTAKRQVKKTVGKSKRVKKVKA